MNSVHIIGRTIVGIICIGLTLSAAAKTFDPNIESECERLWLDHAKRISKSDRPTTIQLLNTWASYEDKCSASGYYWAKRASLEAALGQFGAAKATLKRSPEGAADRSPALAITQIHVRLEEYIAAARSVDVRRLAEFETEVTVVARRFPNWLPAAALLGGLQVLQGRYAQAIQNLEKASTDKHADQGPILRNLTIAYSGFGAHSAALESADEALKVDSNLTADPDFCAAVIISSVRVDLLDDAEIVLKVVLRKNPSARSSPSLGRAARIYNEAREKAGVRK
ncbi:hypothetical protein [Piscinibacterium candidicorallinum]|uniref:Tetratricopeptide repeat protein n=1 Tax=Piscinibacterium candidicorallinum TaxID=1793872 RepID=A0ABV7H4P0_9BURK